MRYKSVKLTNYRNYKERSFSFHDQVNFFIGANARGKTNLLEGIYLTAYGKSFRGVKDKQLIRFGEEACRLQGVFTRESTGEEEHLVDISLSAEGKRKGTIDGIDLKHYSDIFDHVLAVVFSPEDLKLIKESPERRREFMDREIGALSLSYYRNALMYGRVLAQRNAYLKEEKRDPALLSIWDENLVHYGSAMILRRYRFLKRLQEIAGPIHEELSGGKESLRLHYAADMGKAGLDTIRALESGGEEEASSNKEGLRSEKAQLALLREEMEEEFREAAESDLRLRYTTRGPQKDDLEIFLCKKEDGVEINARQFASQGQQRTAALALKLSEIEIIREEKKEAPLLLLDDVLSELDMDRQNYLIRALEDVQLFITATELPEELRKKLPEGKIIAI